MESQAATSHVFRLDLSRISQQPNQDLTQQSDKLIQKQSNQDSDVNILPNSFSAAGDIQQRDYILTSLE